MKVDIIVTHGTAAVIAAKQDLDHSNRFRGSGRFQSAPASLLVYARPAGNVTGLSIQQTDTAGKRLNSCVEIIPNLQRLAIIANAWQSRGSVSKCIEIQTVSRRHSASKLSAIGIRRAEDIAPAFETRKGTQPMRFYCN